VTGIEKAPHSLLQQLVVPSFLYFLSVTWLHTPGNSRDKWENHRSFYSKKSISSTISLVVKRAEITTVRHKERNVGLAM